MQIDTLVSFIFVLVIVLGVLVLWLIGLSKKRKKSLLELKKDNVENIVDFESLHSVFKERGSSSEKLKSSLELIIKNYGHVENDFDKYKDIIKLLCKHPNTNKDLILYFDRELSKLNPEYKAQISSAVFKGLELR
jgi:hypothetical protein